MVTTRKQKKLGSEGTKTIGEQPKTADRQSSKNLNALSGLSIFIAPYKFNFFSAFFVLFLTAIIALIFPLAVRRVVDGFNDGTAALMDQYFAAAVGIAGLLALGTALRFYLITKLGERIIVDIRSAVFSRAIGMSPVFFEKIMTGEVLSRLTSDTTLILSVVSSSVSLAVRNILLFMGGLLFMLGTSAKLSALVLILVPIVIVPILAMGRRLRALSKASQAKIADSSGFASELLLASQTVQANTFEDSSRENFSQISEDSFQIAKKRILVRSVMTAFIIFIVFTGIVCILWVGARDVRSGNMTAGYLVQFVIYSVMVAGSVAALSEIFGELQRAAGATERLVEILNIEDPIQDTGNSLIPKNLLNVELTLAGVNFIYPSRPEITVLEDLSFTVKTGETIAIVGPSGSGKSTIFKILMRFYDIDSGAINLNKLNIKDLSLRDLRNCFALVPQEPVIFGTTVRENIRFGRPEATDEEVSNASNASAAHEFVTTLPNGYDTFVGERGIMLSVGQKQRIGIARAILRESPILLFDEATSSLDAESERAVQSAIEELSKNKTVIVIAHRLSTVKKADRIIVLENGKINAEGTHSKLVKENGLYSRLAKLQFLSA